MTEQYSYPQGQITELGVINPSQEITTDELNDGVVEAAIAAGIINIEDITTQPLTDQFVENDVLLSPPTMKKTVLITPPHHDKFNADGSINQQFYVGCPGGTMDKKTGQAVILFKGTDPYFRSKTDPEQYRGRNATSAIFGAKVAKDGQITFFDQSQSNIEDRSTAKPVLVSSDGERLAPEGQEDARITRFAEGTWFETHLITVNSVNKEAFRAAMKKANGDKSIPLDAGATPELYMAKDIDDPETYVALGNFGPDMYFKNVVIHPELVEMETDVDGVKEITPHVVMFCRELPSIQAFTIPLVDFPRLINEPAFRKDYWEKQLEKTHVEEATILEPKRPWEGANDHYNPDGQIAAGAPPVEVTYINPETQEETKAWLLVYNGVPWFNENKEPEGGRVIGAALLNKQRPWEVIARSRDAIIRPTTPEEVSEGRYPNITFATGSYIDNDGLVHILYTGGDANVTDATCQKDELIQYLLQFDKNGDPRESYQTAQSLTN